MPPAARGRAWASAEEWQSLKDIITELWWDEDKPLKEVAEIMREKHGFLATEKMYKARLKTWGLTKNLKATEAKQIMDMAKSGVVKGPLVIRGRSMGAKKWQKRLNKVTAKTEPSSSVVPARTYRFWPTPSPDHLTAPDNFMLTEVGLKAIVNFAKHRFESHEWDLSGLPYDFDSDKADNWSGGFVQVTRNLVKDRNATANFTLLHKLFDQAGGVIDQATPALIPGTLWNIVHCLRVGPELADTLIRYVHNLVSIKLGQAHPLTCFWAQMHNLGAVQIQQILPALIQAYFDVIVDNSHPANRWRIAMYPTYAKLVQKLDGGTSPSSVVTVFEKTIKGIEECQESKGPVLIDTASSEQIDRNLHEIKIYLSIYLHEQKQYQEADRIIESVGQWLSAGAAAKYPEQHEQWLRMKALILMGLGQQAEATKYFVETYEARRSRLGLSHSRTSRSMLDLEEHYRQLNMIREAEQLRSEYEASWEENSALKGKGIAMAEEKAESPYQLVLSSSRDPYADYMDYQGYVPVASRGSFGYSAASSSMQAQLGSPTSALKEVDS